MKIQLKIFSLAVLLHLSCSYADPMYFLCGPDEDGCFADDYSACACIQEDHEYKQPHCLNFATLQCKPLSAEPNCQTRFIYKDQAHCLSTIFQSMPDPVCQTQTLDFCQRHHIQFCDNNGDPHNCGWLDSSRRKINV